MKIELIKEVKNDGTVFYYVYADGKFVECFINEQAARKYYEEYTPIVPTKEVLKTREA